MTSSDDNVSDQSRWYVSLISSLIKWKREEKHVPILDNRLKMAVLIVVRVVCFFGLWSMMFHDIISGHRLVTWFIFGQQFVKRGSHVVCGKVHSTLQQTRCKIIWYQNVIHMMGQELELAHLHHLPLAGAVVLLHCTTAPIGYIISISVVCSENVSKGQIISLRIYPFFNIKQK